MMFPGTMTRPPPPFTSTITRLSSRSLNFQDECFFTLNMRLNVETCRRSWKRWPNFHSMFQRWSCCQEFPANLKKNLKKNPAKLKNWIHWKIWLNENLCMDGSTWRLKGDLKLLPKDWGFLFRRFAWKGESWEQILKIKHGDQVAYLF